MKEFKLCKVCSSSFELVNKRYNLVKCTECKLVFSKDVFSEQDFLETYNNLYNNSLQYDTHQKEFAKLQKDKPLHIGRPKLKILNYLLKKKCKRICEVGAGVGIVANYLKKKGIDYIGIELDKLTVEKAQSINLNIINGDFSKLNEIEGVFDAIIAFEVIEHLQDLNLFFKIASEKLKTNSYIGFTVPNYDKRMNYKNHKDRIYQSGPPVHLNFFTIESINKISNHYNFEIVFCEAKKFPYFNWNKIDTYKFFLKSIFSEFNGATLQCVMIKK